jgi:hypothetical protein
MIQLLSIAHDKCYKNINDTLKTLTELINDGDIQDQLTISLLFEVLFEDYDQANYLYSLDIETKFNDYINYYNNVTGRFEMKHVTVSLSTIDAWTLKRISDKIKSSNNLNQ